MGNIFGGHLIHCSLVLDDKQFSGLQSGCGASKMLIVLPQNLKNLRQRIINEWRQFISDILEYT